MKNIKLIYLFVVTLIFSLPCLSADTLRTTQSMALSTTDDTFEKALQFTGFSNAFVSKERGTKKALSSTQKIVGKDDKSPFINELINNKEVWRVEFDSVFLDYKTWNPEWVDRYNPKTFFVLLEPNTGALLKIFSMMEKPDSNIAPEPPASESKQWYQQQGETFLGTVSEPPKVSFYEALEMAHGSSPLKAKEIIAWLTMMKQSQDTIPQPVWVILGRGVPFAGIHEPPGPDYKKNRWVSFVDATSGKLLSWGSAPPVGPRETWEED